MVDAEFDLGLNRESDRSKRDICGLAGALKTQNRLIQTGRELKEKQDRARAFLQLVDEYLKAGVDINNHPLAQAELLAANHKFARVSEDYANRAEIQEDFPRDTINQLYRETISRARRLLSA